MNDVSCLWVYDIHGGSLACSLSARAFLEKAMEEHLETGVDRLVHLPTAVGTVYTILISCVSGWCDSTPQSRHVDHRIGLSFDREKADVKKKYGPKEWEEE